MSTMNRTVDKLVRDARERLAWWMFETAHRLDNGVAEPDELCRQAIAKGFDAALASRGSPRARRTFELHGARRTYGGRVLWIVLPPVKA
ncbi:hypothetical protein N864_23820 [Intrasporangium chromatireducens Q5-1]|uniref:Uncharacterized protein n=1 Tax=Intrasporangium chromatireducens Q5-1 TaxID=584657 RepID=W9GM29_9MICO|nr:hypothetical protein [Intrasporangium chromatireducens]EWT06157.1 hypothetical protein N864_23820 [Intrasporangium chromatireducens Q5-1]